MSNPVLHRAQLSILSSLRHSPSERYSSLRRPTGLESDVFKFHLRKLVALKLVVKLDSGLYALTSTGKEYANNLDKMKRTVQKQPKLSVAIIVSREAEDKRQYLFQQRCRSPFYDFWGCLSGPVQWGEQIEDAAQRELLKQTGLSADFTVKTFYRKVDKLNGTGVLLEDKLFAVVEASNIRGVLKNDWPHGRNQWMALLEFQNQQKYFGSTCDFIELLKQGTAYYSQQEVYADDEY